MTTEHSDKSTAFNKKTNAGIVYALIQAWRTFA
jgi:hypothetical protein